MSNGTNGTILVFNLHFSCGVVRFNGFFGGEIELDMDDLYK